MSGYSVGRIINRDTDCYQHFTMSKYHHRDMICYKLLPKFGRNDTMLSMFEYTFKADHYSLIYYINLNDKFFSGVRMLSAYIHEPDTTELYDSLLAPNFRISKPNHILRVSYKTLHIKRLEPPYDTMCRSYPKRSSQADQYLKRIQNETVTKLNRSISDVMIHDPLETPLLSDRSLENNKSLHKLYLDIVKTQKKDMPESCSFNSTVPQIHATSYPSLGFSVFWPDGLFITNEYKGKILLIDYIVYICSSVGIWFGLSAYSLFNSVRHFNGKNSGTESEQIEIVKGMTRQEMKRFNRLEARMNSLAHQFGSERIL